MVDTDAPGHLPPAGSGPALQDVVTRQDAATPEDATTLKEAP
jgi:hypothetical protein